MTWARSLTWKRRISRISARSFEPLLVRPDSSTLTLRDRFCAHFKCADSDFEARALRLLLPSPWSALAAFLLRLNPALLKTDLHILGKLGRIESGLNLASEVRDL